jgi:hypothetical protein
MKETPCCRIHGALDALIEVCAEEKVSAIEVLIEALADIISSDAGHPYRLLALISHTLLVETGIAIDFQEAKTEAEDKRSGRTKPPLRLVKSELH